MKNVYFVQVDVASGMESTVIYLPYTAGVIVANAWENEKVKSEYEFKDFFMFREPVEEVVARLDNPAVIGFTNYCWNTEYNLVLAQKVKLKYPDCVIIFGGHNVPENTEFLEKYQQIDILSFGEGEVTFGNILAALGKDLSHVGNIAYRADGELVETRKECVFREDYVSPYLDGWFEELMSEYPSCRFNAILETSRGCPNHCAYCDWGLLSSKVRLFPIEKIRAEIEWMSAHHIEFVWGADSNFGLFPRDTEIADALVKAKEETAYPEKIRINYAKNSPERVLEIIRKFNACKLDRVGTTLSFQSLDEGVLKNIGRKNLDLSYFKNLLNVYHKENLQIYSELILGLPGETYESFVKGLCKLFEVGQHFVFEVYYCILLPNSILGSAECRKKFGIKTTCTEIVRYHCPDSAYYIPEKMNIITSTDSMSVKDWRRATVFACMMRALHAFGLVRCFSIYAYKELGVPYTDFYLGLLNYIDSAEGSVIKSVSDEIKDYAYKLSVGINRRFFFPECGNFIWEESEYIFMNVIKNADEFYSCIEPYIFSVIGDNGLTRQMEQYQKAVLRKPGEKEAVLKSDYDFYNYFLNIYDGTDKEMKQGKFTTELVDTAVAKDWQEYGLRVIWYGKMGKNSFKDDISVSGEEREDI